MPYPEKIELPTDAEYGDSSLSDGILIAQGVEFPIHKKTLVARSDYFKAMFYGNFKEATMEKIEIKDVSAKTLAKLLDFIYFADFDQSLRFGTGQIMREKDYKLHKYIRNRVGFVSDFWKANCELLRVADIFQIRPYVASHLEVILSEDICPRNDCITCINNYIFALVHNLEVSQKLKTFDPRSYRQWFRCAKKAAIGEFTPLADFQKNLKHLVGFDLLNSNVLFF